jgi:hypothetical protein
MTPGKNKVTEILESLDDIKRASAPDFFYTRLRARMEKETSEKRERPWILRPAYAVITLALLLLINAFVIIQKQDSSEDVLPDNENSQSLAAEYSLNDNTVLYDLTTEQ